MKGGFKGIQFVDLSDTDPPRTPPIGRFGDGIVPMLPTPSFSAGRLVERNREAERCGIWRAEERQQRSAEAMLLSDTTNDSVN